MSEAPPTPFRHEKRSTGLIMNMQMTFFHKIILTIIAAFAFASLIEFYKTFVDGADQAVNSGLEHRMGSGSYRPRQ